jgi:hypothetical protein
MTDSLSKAKRSVPLIFCCMRGWDWLKFATVKEPAATTRVAPFAVTRGSFLSFVRFAPPAKRPEVVHP